MDFIGPYIHTYIYIYIYIYIIGPSQCSRHGYGLEVRYSKIFILEHSNAAASYNSCTYIHYVLIVITGQSSVNFLFNFVEQLEGGIFAPKANRPFTGKYL